MDKSRELNKLKEKALKDDNLPLKEGATSLVFGVGNPDAEVIFIGEGPGYWEDMKAEPFVGRAGALLDQMLLLIKLPREDVYITNVIMYRAPGNRDPTPQEIDAFRPYLDGIIDIIKPKIICTLGRFSMAKFLPGVYISDVHGKIKTIDWKGKKMTMVPMYHPAAALRNSQIKIKLQTDFEKIPDVLESGGEEIETKDDKMDSEQIKLI